MNCTLSASVVAYRPDERLLDRTMESLARSLGAALRAGVICKASVFLVDNSEIADPQLERFLRRFDGLDGCRSLLVSGHGNVGYGAGHNLAIIRSTADYHLVLNPDVELAEEALGVGLRYLYEHEDVVMLAPAVEEAGGRIGHLCKAYPSVSVLLARGFLPPGLRGVFQHQLERYERADLDSREVSTDIEIASGCFMLCRRPALTRLEGFDPAFFLYFEDFDLSRRLRRLGRIAFVPSVRIVHAGGNAARKGWRHLFMFVRSGVLFFQRYGWVWW